MSEMMTGMRMECGESESIEEIPVNKTKNGGSRDESEEGGWYERSDHPLLNDVVLRKVFEHLKPRDLKVCRGVCKKWSSSTIPFTRSKCLVRIFGDPLNQHPDYNMPFLPGFTVNNDEIESSRIEQFIQVFSKNRLGIPFARFRLGSFCMTDGVGHEFLKLCGDLVKYIILIRGDRFFVEDVSELLKSTPNLVKFYIPTFLRSRSGNIVKLFPDGVPKPNLRFMKNLKSTFDCPEERRKCCPTFLEELLMVGENVSHLSIQNFIEKDHKVTKCTSLEALIVIEKLGRESSIQSLKFFDVNQEHFELLSRMQSNGMKPKRVKAKRVRGTRCFNSAFNIQMATLFKDTLEHCSPVLCSSLMDFPTMLQLKSLELRTMKEFDSGCINLCKIFPVLEKLKLQHSTKATNYIYGEFLTESEPCPKIKSFILNGAHVRHRPFTRIQTVFPNLTELKLNIICDGVQILRSVWSGMPQLKVLKLEGEIQTTGNENLDSIFTGLSIPALAERKDLVKDLYKITTNQLKTETIKKIISGASQERPSIQNLTNLSQLHLSLIGQGNDEHDTPTYLTEMTGYLSLYLMKHIRHLTVEKCEFQKTCCESLVTGIGLQSWIFITSGMEIIPELEAD